MTEAASAQPLLDQLAEDASYFRPELFAVYGIDGTGRPFLGWGMQLGEDEALYYQPGGATWVSTSAEQILRTHQHIGEARLSWLADD
jgi:hypothetical protein